MHKHNHLYSFNYDFNESDLCKLESKHIFNQEEKDKLLFSDIKVDPSHSAFIKRRLDIISSSDDYTALLNKIENENICIEGFKAEYLVLEGDTVGYVERLNKLKDIGFRIEGDPNYYTPTQTYALCQYKGIWYFGLLIKNDLAWHKHKQKPCSYSNSISMRIAKALVNIAADGNKEATLLDACCGVGTIMLEACFAGNNIEGCDINWKVCQYARKNLAHFNYTAKVFRSDIKDINKRYDAAIIDLPYNLTSHVDDNHILHIIKSTAEITDRLVIVSTSDVTNLITKAGLNISAYCKVNKKRKSNVFRKIWVCGKEG